MGKIDQKQPSIKHNKVPTLGIFTEIDVYTFAVRVTRSGQVMLFCANANQY